MYQIDNSTAATSQPASTPAGTPGFFTDGNPATNVPATIVPAEWLNAVMMELMNIVVAGGLTPTKNVFTQVLTALKAIGKQRVLLTDVGAANVYAATNVPALTAGSWVDGVVQFVKIANANTGASTYSPDGLTAIPIYGLGLSALQGGELRANCVAALVRATVPGINSGNSICVLLQCFGAPLQIAPATQSSHAMQLGQAVGRLLKRSVFTSSGTFTALSSTTKIRAILVGGGGAGGGAQVTNSGQNAFGSGGGSGAYTEIEATTGFSGGISVTVGAGGVPVSGNNGGNGGQSSLGTLATAPGGGGGGQGLIANTANGISLAGAGASAGVVGAVTYSILSGGSSLPGGIGIAGALLGGAGAAGYQGSGGGGPTNSGAGQNASGYGAGGGGAASAPSTAARSGGAGSQGIVIVEEYA